MKWVLDPPQVVQGDNGLPNPYADRQRKAESKQTDWMKWILVALVVFFAARQFRPPPGPSPDDDTVVDVDGKFAAIFYTDDLSDDQAEALGVEVAEAAEDAGFEYRKFRADQDLSSADDVWRALRDATAEPPSLIWSVDGRAKTKPLTTKADAIEAFKGAAE